MAAYFLSDLHLRSSQEDKTLALDQFLGRLLEMRRKKSPAAPTHLFLVGDIFDLWIGSHAYFQNKFQVTIGILRELIRSGVEIHYFEGNHDLHLHGFWQNDVGAQVHAGPARFQLGPWKVQVEHGDQMNPDDRGYLFLRWFLRTAPLRALAMNLPARAVGAIGEWASGLSRRHPGVRPIEAIREMLRRHARDVHARDPFDYLIAGHVHIVEDSSLPNGGRVVNLGCWDESPRAYRLDDHGGIFLTDLSKI